MNNKNTNKEISSDIPQKIFRTFLDELSSAGMPVELVGRLDKVLMNKETPNEADIRTSIFSDTQNI